MEEILRMFNAFRMIFIICCGTCATLCQTGGEEQVKEIVEKLRVMGREL